MCARVLCVLYAYSVRVLRDCCVYVHVNICCVCFSNICVVSASGVLYVCCILIYMCVVHVVCCMYDV